MKIRWAEDERGGTLRAKGVELALQAVDGAVSYRRGELELTGDFPTSGTHPGMELRVLHSIRQPTHLYLPHLAPEQGQVVGDYVFRSPAFIVADRNVALGLVVDVDDVGSAQGYRTWLDYDHAERAVTFGAGAYRMEGHVFFRREPLVCVGQRARLRVHVLASNDPQDCKNPYGMVARWLWNRWGRPLHGRGGSQRAPLARSMAYVERWAFSSEGWGDEVWQSFELGGTPVGAPVFIVDVTRHPSVPPRERTWREPRSVWNQAWFSTQRCANGLHRYARRVGSPDLARRARQMTEIALRAPASDGLFPSIVAPASEDVGWARVRWTNSDRRPPSVSPDACHLVDAAFTSRMLLEWHDLVGDPRAYAVARRCAGRLVRLQRASGAFPGWVEPDGAVPSELAESAESAVGVALLLDLAPSPGTWSDGFAAAMRGIGFLERVIADARWEDFETYYSCAPWGAPDLLGQRAPRNGVFKQNTLSIAWCAEAMRKAWLATGRKRYLRLARRCIDELSLYQAVWDPPFLPAPAHGGFGVMNADSEWNDARQSLFAPLYFDLHRETGDPELLERGVSALRASFSMLYCPENVELARAYERRFPFFGPESYGFMMENQGHGGGEPIGTFTIFSWGNGSALAAAATILDRFGDVHVDEARLRYPEDP